MEQSIQAIQDASPETQEILKELEAEGRGAIPGSEPAPKQEEQPKEPKPKAEEPAPKADPKTEDQDPTPDQKPNQSDEGKNDKPKREPKYVPVGIHTQERHKRQEAEEAARVAREEADKLRAQLANAANKPATETQEDDLKEIASSIAKKHGIDPEFVSELTETITKLAAKKTVLPSDIKAEIDRLKQSQSEFESERAKYREQELERAQENAFQSEFSSVLKEFPDLADQKEDLKQLAFSEGNTHIPLRLLVLQYRHDNGLDKPGRKTAEDSIQTANKGSDNILDFANMTEEQLRDLDGDALDQYLSWIDKNSRR